MTKMLSENPKVSLQDIQQFEQEYNVELPKKYIEFLLEYNGGFPKESCFKISDNKGEDLVNRFYGIGNMKSNLGKVLEILEGEIPDYFISVANTPVGDEILLGIGGKCQDKVCLWIHDMESEEEMDNMFILADRFADFFEGLYDTE